MAKDLRNYLRWAMPLGNGSDAELIIRAHLPINPDETAILSRMLELAMALVLNHTAQSTTTTPVEDIPSVR